MSAGTARTDASIDRCAARLRDYVEANGVVPSMAALAELWGFASKSSAARMVDRLAAGGVVERAPGGRLRPGPAFVSSPVPEPTPPDAVDDAARRWLEGYATPLSHAYELTTRVLRLARSIEAGLARTAAAEGLTGGELLVLDTLYRVGPPYRIAPTALKAHFLISLAGVGKRVDRLHRLGLVDRVADDRDGRSRLVELNDAGRAVLDRLAAADRTAPHIVWPLALSAGDRATLNRVLRLAQQRIDADDITLPGNK